MFNKVLKGLRSMIWQILLHKILLWRFWNKIYIAQVTTTEQSLLMNGMFTSIINLKSNDLKESMNAFIEKRPRKYLVRKSG